MTTSDSDWDPQREEFELIADELEVPSNKRDFFVENALEIEEMFKYAQSLANNPRENRREFLKALNAALKSLQKAKSLIESQAVRCDLVLSSEFRAAIGQIVNPPGVQCQLSKPLRVSERDFRDYWDTSKQNTVTEDMTPGAFDRAEWTVFAQDPGHALRDLLDLQCKMLELEISGWTKDRGGPGRKRVRKYILANLLNLHDKVFDNPATPTPSGKFCTMCSLLFESFGESIVGLDEAIKHALKKQSGKS